MKGKCAILLVRVSTEIQDYEPQIKDLEAYARQMGFSKLKKIETKESGLADTKSKVGLNLLYDFIQKNTEYKTVFATELSRLARRQSILHEIKEWFISNKVQLYLKDSGYSLFDEYGKVTIAGEMMFTLYGLFAESEMKQKKERFARSKKSLMEMGLSIGGKTLFGYERINTDNNRTTLIPHSKNAEIVQSIFNWYVNGIDSNTPNPSIKTIALECIKRDYPIYTHSKRNINKLLKEDGYKGLKVTNNKRKNPDYQDDYHSAKYIVTSNKIKYPQLISSDLFDAVQVKLSKNNSKADKSSKHTTILARLIICPVCGNHYNGDYRTKNGVVKNNYRCTGRAKAMPCSNKQTVGMVMMDSLIWCLIKTDLSVLAKSINELSPNEDYAVLSKQKKAIEKMLAKMDDDLLQLKDSVKKNIKSRNINMSDVLSSFQSNIERLDKEKGQLQKELDRLSTSINLQKQRLDNVQEVISSNIHTIETSKEMLKKYVNYFVDSIHVLLHDNSYTALRIHFKNYSFIQYRRVHNGKVIIDDGEYLKQTFVVIDKTRTLKMKAIKLLRPFEVTKSNKIKFNSFSITMKDLFAILSNQTDKYKHELRDVKTFDFIKLNAE